MTTGVDHCYTTTIAYNNSHADQRCAGQRHLTSPTKSNLLQRGSQRQGKRGSGDEDLEIRYQYLCIRLIELLYVDLHVIF